ncbi:unnamed protein product [Prorocentrum cordatum]|uniref:Uncharacterized protein n=1 Tax=Prorocentrum cordatum TaxID=2364126 RepID=A0ABN9RUM3_9DINO|nr:unnamed protein product [Polarella glacialis]
MVLHFFRPCRGAMAAVRLAIVAQRAAAEASAPPGSTQGGTPAAVMPPAPELLAAAERRLQAAREHWRVVFGASAGGCGGDAFEARNPSLFPGSAARAAFQQGLPWWGSGTCVNDGPRQGPGDAAQCASAGGLAGPPSVEPSSVERSGLLPESDAAWDIFG